MSEITTIRQKVKNLVEYAYQKTEDVLSRPPEKNVLLTLINDSLTKKPIESENGIIRHILIESSNSKQPYYATDNDYLHVIDQGFTVSKVPDREKILRNIYGKLSIEIMPKVRFWQNQVTFLDMIDYMYNAVKSVGQTQVEPAWIESENISQYGDKDSIHLLYGPAGNSGFVNLAEGDKGKNDFKYPEFNGYTAPTLKFRILDSAPPHRVEGPAIKYHFDVLNKTYEMLKKIQ